MANRTRDRRKPPRPTADNQKSERPTAESENGRRLPKLSPADIAELAQQMQMPEGMLQMVLDRYPELGKPLALRWALTARNAA